MASPCRWWVKRLPQTSKPIMPGDAPKKGSKNPRRGDAWSIIPLNACTLPPRPLSTNFLRNFEVKKRTGHGPVDTYSPPLGCQKQQPTNPRGPWFHSVSFSTEGAFHHRHPHVLAPRDGARTHILKFPCRHTRAVLTRPFMRKTSLPCYGVPREALRAWREQMSGRETAANRASFPNLHWRNSMASRGTGR